MTDPALVQKKERPYLGKAVQNGEILFSSVSQIVTFDPSMEGGCNRRWAFIYVFGKKEEKSAAQLAGNKFASSLECYLKTGYDAMEPELRVAKHYLPVYDPSRPLEVEQDLAPDILRAIELRKQFLRLDASSYQRVAPSILREMKVAAGLLAANIPLIGAFDFRHQRGEYLDGEGVLRREDPRFIVGETVDLKSTSRINQHTTRTGTVLQGYAKTVEAILNHPQMLGYGVHDADTHPEHTHERLGHVYIQTKNGLVGAKRTGILTVDEVRERWRTRVEPQARGMIDVAKISRIDEASANFRSCTAYGKPCPHTSYCPRKEMTIFDALGIEPGESMSLGLFASVSAAVSPASPPSSQGLGLFGEQPSAPSMPPPIPIISEEERLARIATATMRLQAEDAGVPPLPSLPAPVRPCGAPGCGVDCAPGCVGSVPCPACLGKGAAGLTAVLPPDAAPSTPLEDASPLSAEEIAKITDPTLRQRVEEHARLAAEAKEKEDAEKAAAGGQKTSGNCPGGKQKVMIASPKARGNKVTCTACGRVLPVKPAADGSAIVPGHRLQEEKTQTGQTATGIPALPSGIPTLPVNIPPSPGGVPPLPTDIPPLPGGVPSSPILFTVEQVSAALDRVLAPLLQQVQEMQRQITALSK